MLNNNPLEQVSYPDLVALADANETFADYAVDVFARYHSNKLIFINLMADNSKDFGPIYEGMRGGTIEITHFETALKVLK